LISSALLSAYERDYTHLTVVAEENRALLGYLSIPRLKELLKQRVVREEDPVEKAMMRFRRRGTKYTVITTETELEDLETFFNGGPDGKSPQDFAVVTDEGRKFVLGVVTRSDLEEFVKRRPG
jgi:CBS domain-containing protein